MTAPGANPSDSLALFEATHGTAPKYAGKDQVNPGSLFPALYALNRDGKLRNEGELIEVTDSLGRRLVTIEKVPFLIGRRVGKRRPEPLGND